MEACYVGCLLHIFAHFQSMLRKSQAYIAYIVLRRGVGVLGKKAAQVSRRDEGYLCHTRQRPVFARLLAHSVLHAVHGRVQVVAVLQEGR